MSRTVWRRGLVSLTVGTLLLTACASRPSAEELTESILRASEADDTVSLTGEQAACIADELLDSDLGDTTVSGLAENFDNPEVLASDVDDVERTVAEAAILCAGS